MKIQNLVRVACLVMLTGIAPGAGASRSDDMKSALSNCRDEAISTGLQQESDITAYINLCMQAWQMPPGTVEPEAAGETASPEASPDAEPASPASTDAR